MPCSVTMTRRATAVPGDDSPSLLHTRQACGPSWAQAPGGGRWPFSEEPCALGFGSPQPRTGPESHQQALLGAGGGDITGDIFGPNRQVWVQPRGLTYLPLLLKRMGICNQTPSFYYDLKCYYKSLI